MRRNNWFRAFPPVFDLLQKVKQSRKQPDITRQAILRAAGEGFALHGYAATGIGGIAERSGLTRGALFHHFDDKRGLAVAWVREALAPDMREVLASTERVSSFVEWKAACLEMLRAIDVQHPVAQLTLLGSEWSGDDVLCAEAAGVLEQWLQHVADALGRGQSEGWIHRSIQPQDEALLLVSHYCGMSVVLRTGERASVLRSGERALGAYLETLRGGV